MCTRPFRAAGPRIEREQVAGKTLVHNYGHGGAGWSLSWGSAARVTALLGHEVQGNVAVIGSGALGLTTALRLQEAGAKVRIYARDLPPAVRSSRATGSWTPDARVALRQAANASFAAAWEQMARISFEAYTRLLKVPGEPIKVVPRYVLSALPPEAALAQREANDPIGFAHLEHRIADLWPAPLDSDPEMSPFTGLHARFSSLFRFDISAYSRHLLESFQNAGGVIHRAEFHGVEELLRLPEPAIINCTGYGARTLFNDPSVVPIRGQINWLPAQDEVQYSLQWESLNVVARPDGIVVQLGAGGDSAGWNDAAETPDIEEAARALATLDQLQQRRKVEKEAR